MRTVCIVVMTCMIPAAAAGFVFAQEFSAATRNVYQDRVQEGKVYISENKIRFETAGVINIIRLDKKILLSLDPGRKSYVETILPPDHIPSFRGELPGEIHRTFICSETLDGRDVDKYIVITKGFEGNKNIHIWVAKDISWPIKRKSTDGSWESTLSDIAIGPLPPELFEVPEGYQKEAPQE
ncbi:MAG TPA: hypothetical protein PK107_06080 [Candidatus Omnitrophota bacterium]|nr:hypothetical protein [Candidatus Omnitrophota bacterium]